MYSQTFSKHWDENNGYTMSEALDKKAKVDEAHGVGMPGSKWNPSEIVPDTIKGGFKVVISSM